MVMIGLPDLARCQVRRGLVIEVADGLAIGIKAVLCKLQYARVVEKARS